MELGRAFVLAAAALPGDDEPWKWDDYENAMDVRHGRGRAAATGGVDHADAAVEVAERQAEVTRGRRAMPHVGIARLSFGTKPCGGRLPGRDFGLGA